MTPPEISDVCLGMLTKYWRPGKVKTRLAKSWTRQAAAGNEITLQNADTEDLENSFFERSASVHRILVLYLMNRLADSASRRELVVTEPEHFAAAETSSLSAWSLKEQPSGDLGQRMKHFFQRHLGPGCGAILIGSDCPSLTARDIEVATELLQTHDLVLGPAYDGGYYLIGLAGHESSSGEDWTSKKFDSLFADIQWSTDRVFDQTLAVAQRLGLRTATLTQRHDIDTIDELLNLMGTLETQPEDRYAVELLQQLQPLF